MEISAWDIYLLTRLESLNYILGLMTVFPALGAALLLLLNQGKLDTSSKIYSKSLVIMAVSFGLVWTLTPTTKEAAAMYVLPKLVNSEATQNLPKDLTSLVHDWAEELSTRTKKKGDRE